jgi:hypothetical protein
MLCYKHVQYRHIFLSPAEVFKGKRPCVEFSGAGQLSSQPSVSSGGNARVSCLRSDQISSNAGGLARCYIQRGTYHSIGTLRSALLHPLLKTVMQKYLIIPYSKLYWYIYRGTERDNGSEPGGNFFRWII